MEKIIMKNMNLGLWLALYDNMNGYSDLTFSVKRFEFDIPLDELLQDDFDNLSITHQNIEISQNRKLQIMKSKQFYQLIGKIKEVVRSIESDVNSIDFESEDEKTDYFNLVVSEIVG